MDESYLEARRPRRAASDADDRVLLEWAYSLMDLVFDEAARELASQGSSSRVVVQSLQVSFTEVPDGTDDGVDATRTHPGPCVRICFESGKRRACFHGHPR